MLKRLQYIFIVFLICISSLAGLSNMEFKKQTDLNRRALADEDVSGSSSIEIKALGCEIFINDHFVGREHFQKAYPPGLYTIIVYKDKNHYAAEKVINLKAGETKKIELLPESIKGYVSVVTIPPDIKGANIYANEILLKEKTPSNIALAVGTYSIGVKHPDYVPIIHHNVIVFENVIVREQFNMISYKGSIKQKEDFWKKQKMIALNSAFIIGIAGGGGGQYMGWETYDKYLSASSEDDAVRFRRNSDNYFKARDISYGISISALIYAGFSYIQELRYSKMLK